MNLDGVSLSCDDGAHERCPGCECTCHMNPSPAPGGAPARLPLPGSTVGAGEVVEDRTTTTVTRSDRPHVPVDPGSSYVGHDVEQR